MGGGEASAAQEPVPEDEDESLPPEPFIYEPDTKIAQEEAPSPELIPQSSPSPALVLEDPEPSAPAPIPDQPLAQDPLAALMLDLNEHAQDHSQDQDF